MSENPTAAAPAAGATTAARKPKRYGLRLTVGGAPAVPHQIPGVPGLYRPDKPTPVGADGELPLDRARELAADPSVHLELVPIAAGDVEELSAAAADALEAARGGVAQATRHADGHEADQVADEVAAIQTAEG